MSLGYPIPPSSSLLLHLSHFLKPRHIQDFTDANQLEPHWGYVDRVLPCTNDPGSCAYLDTVYHSHDLGVWYSMGLWVGILGILAVWALLRIASWTRMKEQKQQEQAMTRIARTVQVAARRYFLPETPQLRPIFGHATRTQLLVLALLLAYLTIFSFVGIVFKTWITPIKSHPDLHNTRTGLGPWSDRVGTFAFALTPLAVMLSSRESILSLVAGVPYQSFMFLHRWTGYVIVVQSSLHTVGWVVVEGRLYQPQPETWNEFIAQRYMVWGVVALVLLFLLFTLSTPWGVRVTGYEVFRKAHYVLAVVYIGACWGHWAQMSCWLIASFVVWGMDRGLRLLRCAWLHYRSKGPGGFKIRFQAVEANVKIFSDGVNGDVVRLEFEHEHRGWSIGQHFFLCFPDLSLWQAHPFTPLSIPAKTGQIQSHSYIVRAKSGQTKKLADSARRNGLEQRKNEENLIVSSSIPVIVTGPYGQAMYDQTATNKEFNILCIAGGTGITFVLPVLSAMALSQALNPSAKSGRAIELIWMVRHRADIEWIADELKSLRSSADHMNLCIRIFVTREPSKTGQVIAASARSTQVISSDMKSNIKVMEDGAEFASHHFSSASSRSLSSAIEDSRPVKAEQDNLSIIHTSVHPKISYFLRNFLDSRVVEGRTRVFASGPVGMLSELQGEVARSNKPGRVWRGDEKWNVQLFRDDRMD